MDLSLSPSEREFRDQLRAWLAENEPGDGPDGDEAGFEFRRAWQKRLYEAGWAGIAWPREYGGRGATLVEQAIFVEELARARAPRLANAIAVSMIGPTIIAHGIDQQKQDYLAPILSGDEIWCQGFSEPDAGSDLAAIRTHATPEGDGWRISGQKVWTSLAHRSARCLLLARTGSPEPSTTSGLTMFVIDLDQPGVTIRPLRQLTGDSEFSEMFLDRAWVPDSQVLGDPGGGWRVAITTLMHERATGSFSLLADLRAAFDELIDLARSTPWGDGNALDNPVLRDELVGFRVELEVMRLTAYRGMARTIENGLPGPEGSLTKWQWADTNQAMTRCAFGLLGAGAAGSASTWSYRYLRSRANSIEAGTTEVLKSILAERVLGLPRTRGGR